MLLWRKRNVFFNTDLSRARGVNWSADRHIRRWLSIDGQLFLR